MAGNDSYTVSLLHMNGVDASVVFTDGAFGGTHTWTTYGNAQIDTAQSKFGGASGLFNGAGDYIDTPDSTDWTMGNGDFTVDSWFRPASIVGSMVLIGQCDSAGSGTSTSFYIRQITNTITGRVYYGNTGIVASSATVLEINTWNHVALVRNGANLTIYLNGVAGGTIGNIGTETINDSANKLAVGRIGEVDVYYFNGWIDELRISKGIARWTADFSSSLPTGEYGVECQPTIKRFGGVPFVTPNRGVWHRPPKLVTPTMREILKYNIGVW